MGYVKIGELDEFYAIIYKLDKNTKDIIQGFAKSILETRDMSNSLLRIEQRFNNKTIKCTIGEISKDYLFKPEFD
jgi:hypothetical protein